jgi:hypothetical protein
MFGSSTVSPESTARQTAGVSLDTVCVSDVDVMLVKRLCQPCLSVTRSVSAVLERYEVKLGICRPVPTRLPSQA